MQINALLADLSHSVCNSSFLLQTSANRKQVENMAKKKLDNLMKESKIRDREDPDSFTIAGLAPGGKLTDKAGSKVNTDSTELSNNIMSHKPGTNSRLWYSYLSCKERSRYSYIT